MLRYLALGDSYTIGESVAQEERFPVQLTAALRREGWVFEPPEIVARTGWTSGELMAGLEEAAPSGTFDLVTLLIGVNDQYRGLEPGIYAEEFRLLLRRAIAFAAGRPERVLVLSIPDWGAMPYAEGRERVEISREIDGFNRINRDFSIAAGIGYVDITALSRQVDAHPDWIAADGLHPSGAQYRAWVELVLPRAKVVLTSHDP